MEWLKEKLRQLLIHKNDNTLVQFLRSIFVGGLATLVDWAIYSLLIFIVRMNPIPAACISFVFGLIVNYYLTQIWVFSYTPTSMAKSFTTFTIIGLVGLGLNFLLFWIDDQFRILEHLLRISNQDYINLLKKIVVTFIVYIWNFFARKYFIFRETKSSPDSQSVSQSLPESEVNP